MKTRTWAMMFAVLALGAIACGYSDTSGNTVATTAAAGGDVGGAAQGQQLFASSCAACHGSNAEGIDGLGPDLHNNAFIESQSNAELILFIAVGRSTTDPDNVTGIAMPPKGGNSSLTDQDLADIVDYLRTLQ